VIEHLYQLLFVRMVKLAPEEKIKNTMLIGFGLTLILQNIALLLWTADDRGITTSYSGAAFSLLGVRFPYVRVAGLIISVVCLFALQQFLRKTYTGKAIRATVEDWEAASMMGIDVHKVYLLSFLLAPRGWIWRL
jgi:branched-chain amino acid transport system permease protein